MIAVIWHAQARRGSACHGIHENAFELNGPLRGGVLLKHPLTDSGLAAFLADWKKTGKEL